MAGNEGAVIMTLQFMSPLSNLVVSCGNLTFIKVESGIRLHDPNTEQNGLCPVQVRTPCTFLHLKMHRSFSFIQSIKAKQRT